MPHTIAELQDLLIRNGFEVYTVEATTLHVAERLRFHLLDSGIRLFATEPLRLRFTVRSERSHAPSLSPSAHFARVRDAVAPQAAEADYYEAGTDTRLIPDPNHERELLDIWYEMHFHKPVTPQTLPDEVRYCLIQPRFVPPPDP